MSMSSPYQVHVTAAQVASYFVGQYYQVLQNQPEFVHQFYTDASTVVRIDGHTREMASGMLQIHTLVKSLDYRGVEITTLHSLESWNGSVMMMATGVVHTKVSNARRKFAQTFCLAPQEKGFFLLNDIFHYIEDDSVSPLAYFPNMRTQVNVSPTTQGTASTNFMLVGDNNPMEYTNPADFKENGAPNNYSFSDSLLLHASEVDNISADKFTQLSNGSIPNAVASLQEYMSPPTEEPAEEPQKHTYASIVTKGQSVPSAPSQAHINKSKPAPEWNHVSEPQHTVASANAVETSPPDAEEESPLVEEGELKSVYARNLPPTVSVSEIEEEFKRFGKLGPDAIAIRNRKDLGVCYAFIEFLDITGVHNAIKAASVEIGGQQVFIEERRANRYSGFRGGRRGRYRGGHQYGGPRGGRFGRGYGQDAGEYYNNRGRGNGYYRPSGRQDRGVFVSRATQDQSEYE
ncbi:nuclear transport factor 2-like isoform X2 [Impatiens glandulifera]|uniref:nuclear transport factor 2-like isoform X2 n=1 Tax=Impatiens glandulifera TaxID=253017 RepID=UPI001FB081BC|nr:nuclear transport factor 2-like isoform X2 [Impatiens glandulifera]